MPHVAASPSLVFARLLRDVLTQQTFADLFELREALKTRGCRLRIPYDATAIEEAIRVVGSNRPLVRRVDRTGAPVQAAAPSDHVVPISRDDAPAVLAKIRARLGPVGPQAMPKARVQSARQVGAAKAMALVLGELEATAARCDALEREVSQCS